MFTYPQLCSVCLGKPDRTVDLGSTVQQTHSQGVDSKVLTASVPICSACFREVVRRRFLAFGAAGLVILATAATIVLTVSNVLPGWMIFAAIAGGLILIPLSFFGFAREPGRLRQLRTPADAAGNCLLVGVPTFRNPAYQEQFDTENRVVLSTLS